MIYWSKLFTSPVEKLVKNPPPILYRLLSKFILLVSKVTFTSVVRVIKRVLCYLVMLMFVCLFDDVNWAPLWVQHSYHGK